MSTANQQQSAAWNGESGRRWVADADRRDEVLAPVADTLLAAARLQGGQAVVDIGCGCGATTLAAADAVSPGRVVGVDLSTPMLEVARQRARHRPVSFVRADAQTEPIGDQSFDAAISRFGTMFFDDQRAAFANVRRATRPGGRLCIATWQPLAENDWLTVPGAALLRYGPLPAAAQGEGPGMFAQSDPAAVAAVLTSAGWHDVDIEPVSLRLRLGADAAEATDYLAGSRIARSVLDTIDADRQDEAIAAVRAELADHESSDGVCLAGAILIVRATRSS